MSIRMPCLLALTLTMTLATMTAQAGALLKTKVHDIASNNDSETLLYAQDGNLRVETGDAQKSYAIFSNDALYAIDPKDKTYTTLDRASIAQMADQLNPALKQLQEQLAKMTPEQRAQMEKMLGKRVPGLGTQTVQDIRKTTRTDDVAGYHCNYTEVLQDGVLSAEFCVVPQNALKGGKELAESSARVSALVADMLKQIDAPWLKQLAEKQIEDYAKLGGIPVASRTFSDGKPTRESTLESATTQTLPATLFQVPAGFTKKDMLQPKRK
ncbi:MAG TPA: hypothetical protein VGN07_04790 [Steroidobacteraceae bacterium]|jgi:hypothetical protein